MQDLATEGLLEFSAYRPFTVREVSEEEIAESLLLRRLLEPPLARLAARRAEAPMIDAARTALRDLRTVSTQEDQIITVERYYDALLDVAGSALFRACLKPLRDLPWHTPSGGTSPA